MAPTTEGTTSKTQSGLQRPRISAPKAPFATVLVGHDLTRFVVHESLLLHYSKFFRTALTGKSSEAKDKTVKLEEECPYVFEIFVHWLYHQRFPDKDRDNESDILKPWPNFNLGSTDFYVLLHIFGDKYDVPELKIGTINQIVRSINVEGAQVPYAGAIDAAFSSLPSSSPLCQLLVDVYYYYADPNQFDDIEEYKNLVFLHCVWCKLAQFRNKAQDAHSDLRKYVKACDYHEHKTAKEKAACQKKRREARKHERSKLADSDAGSDDTER